MLRNKQCNYFIFGLGLILFTVGISIRILWPLIFTSILRDELELTSSSETYKLWMRTPIPMYLELYLFNWTNSREFIINKSVIPNFEEIGPFVFEEVHDRVNVTWNDNYTVTFNQTRTWSFIPEKSVDLSTKITNINVIATTVAFLTRAKGPVAHFALDKILNMEENLFVTKPANEWLFDGMDDNLLNLINSLQKIVPIPIPYKKFGWFYDRNLSASYDGAFTMKTGGDNIYNLGIMDSWNYSNQTDFYEGACSMVNGTSGELFPPMKELQQNTISAFISDMCSSITLNYSDSVSVEGINGYKYIGGESIFDNGTLYPEKSCFCVGECIPSGALNVSACRNAPVFMSFPHFYLADPYYSKPISGMKPNETEHQFYLILDPTTGVPLEVRAQFQINLLLQPYSWYKMFKNVPKVFVPMMWFRQRAKITPDLASRDGLIFSIYEGVAGLWDGIAAIGLLIIIFRLMVIIQRRKKLPEEEPVIDSTVPEDN